MGLLTQVLGSVLGSRSGGARGSALGGGSMSPIVMAILGLLASKALGGRNGAQQSSGGGLLDGLLGGGATNGTGLGSLGGLAEMLTGNSTNSADNGGRVASGLGGLMESFQKSGHGDIANSWVADGENKPIAPHQLQDALGGETVDQLSQQTGLPQDELLQQLSQALPSVVDGLTPNGRLPNQNELANY